MSGYQPRPYLPAVIGPRAAWVMAQEVGPQLERLATRLSTSAHAENREVSRELFAGVEQLRESGRQWRERNNEQAGRSPGCGTAEVPNGTERASLASSSSDPLVSAREAAKRIGKSERWVTKLCETGRLLAAKPGKAWEIDPGSIRDYLLERKPVA